MLSCRRWNLLAIGLVSGLAISLALELAERVTRTPAVIDDELFGRARYHFMAAQIVELGAICAWENYRARFNRVLDIEPHGLYRAGRRAEE